MPNTARVKLAVNASRLQKGLGYVGHGYAAIGVLLFAALLATWFLRRCGRATLLVSWTLVAGWTLYLLAIGGDIFPGWRQLVFVFPPLCTLLAEAAEQLADRLHRTVPLALAALPFAAGHVFLQRADGENRRADAERWEWDGRSVGRVLKTAFADKSPLLAVDAAGALPYWSELPALDMLGLNDAFIAEHRPPTFGQGEIGHELGDGAYVLRRRPDLIAFDNAVGRRDPIFLAGRQLVGNPSFAFLYRWVRVRGDTGDVVGELWVRREGGPLGMVRSENRMEIPGYFVCGEGSSAVAQLDGHGALVGRVSKASMGLISSLLVPRGRWKVEARSPGPGGAAVGIRCDGRDAVRTDGEADVLDFEDARSIAIAVAPSSGPGPISIDAVTLTRVSATPSLRCPPVRPPGAEAPSLHDVGCGLRAQVPAPSSALRADAMLGSAPCFGPSWR